MFKKTIKKLAFSGFVVVFVLLAHYVLAAPDQTGINAVGEVINLPGQDPRLVVANIIRILLGFLGILAVLIILYAGWIITTSQGNTEKIEKAKAILKNAFIGLLIILSAFGIASFIINVLSNQSGGNSSFTDNTGGGGGHLGGATLGSGIIDSHYPARDATGVPRNTKIAITFKAPIDPFFLINDDNNNGQYGDCVSGVCDTASSTHFLVYKTVDGVKGPFVTNVFANKTSDNKIFVFTPKEYLGSAKENVWYSVGISNKLKKMDTDLAFPGILSDPAYIWSFEVGTIIDNTPPQISSVAPLPDVIGPRNTIIQINFNEAVNPLAVTGATSKNFTNLRVSQGVVGKPIAGQFYISNQYRTVEFFTEDQCGVNSCGETVYCLPGSSDVRVLAQAATLLIASEPMARLNNNGAYDGVVDMVGNSLDGNTNGEAQGPQTQSGLPPFNANVGKHDQEGDDYTWNFKINNSIDITAPRIVSIEPNSNDSGVALNAKPMAVFNKILSNTSLNSNNVKLSTRDPSLNFWVSSQNNYNLNQTDVTFNHSVFLDNTNYLAEFTSGVRDQYQNCYQPCSGLTCNGNLSCCDGAQINDTQCKLPVEKP